MYAMQRRHQHWQHTARTRAKGQTDGVLVLVLVEEVGFHAGLKRLATSAATSLPADGRQQQQHHGRTMIPRSCSSSSRGTEPGVFFGAVAGGCVFRDPRLFSTFSSFQGV
jgi:hypothetical protein